MADASTAGHPRPAEESPTAAARPASGGTRTGLRLARAVLLAAVPAILVALAALRLAPGRTGSGPWPYGDAPFVDMAPAVGIDRILAAGSQEKFFILENVGSGAGILDYDGDGLPDIFLANAGWIREKRLEPGPGASLYRQLPDGRFEETAERAGIRHRGWGTGVAVGDVEDDGDPDIFLGTIDDPLLFVNGGDGTFREKARESGLDRRGYITSSVFLDADRDGDLDLYTTRYVEFDFDHLPNGGAPCIEKGVEISCGPTMHEPVPDLFYLNLGHGKFADATEKAGMGSQDGPYGLGCASGDIDDDGWPDIYVTNDTTANFLWHNRKDGTFEEIGIEAGCALGENAQGQSGMGVDLADANGDGKIDIFVANYAEEYNAYYENLGSCSFADRTYASGLNEGCFLLMGWGSKFIDRDQDGILDLFVVNGHVMPQCAQFNPALTFEMPILFYRGDGDGKFTRIDGELGPALAKPRSHRSTPVGDLDGDGDLDIVVTVLDAPPLVLANGAGRANRSLILRLSGVKSNREGIGARVEISAGGRRQVREVTRGGGYLSASDAIAHFGLGESPRADAVEIRWPSGAVDRMGPLDAGATYRIEEGGKVLAVERHGPGRWAGR